MPKGSKQAVIEPDVYEAIKAMKDSQGIQMQWFVNNTLREKLGIKKEVEADGSND